MNDDTFLHPSNINILIKASYFLQKVIWYSFLFIEITIFYRKIMILQISWLGKNFHRLQKFYVVNHLVLTMTLLNFNSWSIELREPYKCPFTEFIHKALNRYAWNDFKDFFYKLNETATSYLKALITLCMQIPIPYTITRHKPQLAMDQYISC